MWFPQAKTSLCVSDECKLPHIMINPHWLHCCSTSQPSLLCSAVMLGLGLCRPLSCSSGFLSVSANRGHYRRTVSWRKNKELSPSYLPSSFPSAWPSHGSQYQQQHLSAGSSFTFISSPPELASMHSLRDTSTRQQLPIFKSGCQLWGTPTPTSRVPLASHSSTFSALG